MLPAGSLPQSETITSETVWTRCKPLPQPLSPPAEDLLAAVASESLSEVSFQVSSAEGPGPAPSRTLRVNPGAQGPEIAGQAVLPACGVSAYRPAYC